MATFEHNTGALDEFLDLLNTREEEASLYGEAFSRSRPRTHVGVSALSDAQPSNTGLGMIVKRYVVASFVYGDDVVTVRKHVSVGHGVSGFGPGHDPQEVQRVHEDAADDLRDEIERFISDNALPILVSDVYIKASS